MKKFHKKIIAILLVIVLGVPSVFGSLSVAAKNSSQEDPNFLGQITPNQYAGYPAEGAEWTAESAATYKDFVASDSLLNREFVARVKFSKKAKAQLHVGGSSTLFGIVLKSDPTNIGEGNLCLFGADWELDLKQYVLTPEKAGVALVDNEFDLRIRVMSVDHDGGGEKNDIAVSIFINGKLYDDQVIYADNRASMIGTHMSMWLDQGASLSVKPYTTQAPPKEDDFLGEMTLNQYTGFPAEGLELAATTSAIVSDYSAPNTLLNREFVAKVKFPKKAKAQLHVGGVDAYYGIVLKTDPTKIGEGNLSLSGADWELALQQFTLTPEKAGVALVDNELELRIRISSLDYDGDGTKDDIAVRVYINGKLYDNQIYYATNAADKIGTHLFTYLDPGATLSVKPLTEAKPPEEDPILGEITPNDYMGYPQDGEDWAAQDELLYQDWSAKESLLNREFVAKVKFSKQGKSQLHMGAKAGWYGIVLKADPVIGEKNLCLYGAEGELGGQQIVLTSEKAGVDLVGNEFELRLRVVSVDHDGGGVKNDIAVRIYINGTLYDNKVIYADNVTSLIGNHLFLYVEKGAEISMSAVLDESDKPLETVPSYLKTITFSDYAISPGKYGYNKTDLAIVGAYSGSMDGTFFTGDVIFDNSPAVSLIFGGASTPWYGLYVVPTKNGRLRIYDPELKYLDVTLKSKTAGCELLGNKFKLGLSTEFVDSDEDGKRDDVRLGVWINDKLYFNQYFYLIDYAERMGQYLGLYSSDEAYFIRVDDVYETAESGPVITPDQDLVRITWSSFNVNDGFYDGKAPEILAAFGGLSVYHPDRGNIQHLDGTLLDGNVTFSSASGSQIRIGGKEMGWFGLVISSSGDNLYLVDAEGKTDRYVFKSKVAGMQLTDEEINLKMSFQIVDSDQDGQKDDVRLGVWFNDVPYCNRYIYLKGYAQTLGNMLGVYSNNTNSVIRLKSVDCRIPLDFSIWGFTKNWKKELRIKQ